MEAPPRFELGMRVLQTRALPLGYSAIHMVWLDQESNQGHEDFQSSALPTELSSLAYLLPKTSDILSYILKSFIKSLVILRKYFFKSYSSF